jgi:c-di-GMP-binding flagellar brake protein YcgR
VSSPTSFVQSFADRRRNHRARIATSVTVTVGAQLLDAVSSDLSAGGIRLVADEPAAPGDAVSVVFFLDGDIVCARGQVRWCAKTTRGLYAFGVAFTAVEDDGLGLVARFCRASIS